MRFTTAWHGRAAMLVGLIMVAAPPLAAQRLVSPELHSYVPMLSSADGSTKYPSEGYSDRPTNHWVEGAVVGGTALGVFGGLVGYDLCHEESDSGSCLLPALTGAALSGLIGVVVGGIVGSFFPKSGA